VLQPKSPAYSGTLRLVETLWERLKYVMDSQGLNASGWAEDAELPRATVRLAIKNRRESMESRTLAALAKAANVSLEWLATGGFGPNIPADPVYPSRPRAIAAAYLVGYSEATIAAVSAVTGLSGDPGVDYWLTMLRAKHLEEAQAPKLLPAPADEHSR
jgi:hypothetical protein